MEPKGSLPQLQEPTNCHYPVPDETSAHIPTCLFETHFNSILCSTPRFSKWSLSIRFSHQHRLYILFFHIFNTKYHTQKHKILCPLNHKTTAEQQQTTCIVPSVFYYYDEVQKM